MIEEELNHVRRFAAMLTAAAVRRRFPDAKLGGVELTESGFHSDFDVPRPLTEVDVAAIEEEMHRIVEAGADVWPPRCRSISSGEALRLFEGRGERWRAEWVRDHGAAAPLVRIEYGECVDVYAGELREAAPERVPAFKLLHAAGAYWRGDSANPVLQRICGAVFADRAELDGHLAWQEEARQRDHRKLGKQLELFMFAEEAPGMPFYLPNGAVVRNELEALSREFLRKYGYEEVRTPMIMDRALWEQSGHWEHYRDNMYFSEMERRPLAVKPMNCPGHMLLFKHKLRSYKELPLRYAEFGQVHRHEFSGALNGLLRVRTFCQDDAHVFAAPGQIESEMLRTIELVKEMYAVFGFEYGLELSTRPRDSMGSDEQWAAAETALERVLRASGLPFRVNPGDGAFYGPKIDFHIKDALGRSHQCATIQLDFLMPEKFGLAYVDERNERKVPIVIHRAVYGSIDRFFGILIEHYAGAFPLWLAPVQAIVVPVADRHADDALRIRNRLTAAGIRAEADVRSEKLGYKVREAQLRKIPYVAAVGDREIADGVLQVRERGRDEQTTLGAEEWLTILSEKIRRRE
ncbi:threonine--tRNA ligase [Paenibacillus sp.]|uniref:threonine--tRNA ligase n=1 Tax=Paenibacillus sp. TaxID=58172 RepID=UPI002810EEA1|nr:threonine--tRNA ligase [Paenibacillus sp.]